MWQCDVRQGYRAAPMAHDPLISSNQHSGPWQSSRFQPTGGRQVPSPSERCRQTIAKTLIAAWMSTQFQWVTKHIQIDLKKTRLGVGNGLDFNQQAGGRCHLLPSLANRVGAPSLKRCLLRECLHWLPLGQNNWPIPYNKWLHLDYRWQDDLKL